jgi:phosphate-selective porin OprO/OprP
MIIADGVGRVSRAARGIVAVAVLVPGTLGLMMAGGARAQSPTTDAVASDSATVSEVKALEERIRILEQKLEALQQAAPAISQAAAPPAPAVQPGVIAQPGALPPNTVVVAAPAIPAPVAQSTTSVQAGNATTAEAPQIYAGPSGFAFSSKDGANQIRFHGEFAFDGRFYDDDTTPEGSRSTWLLRRARPIIEGTFANIFDFRFNPDFAGGKTVIQDAFVAARFDPAFVVTAGKFKEPFGLERLQQSPNNRFIELGLPSDLVPNRDLGVQVSGTFPFVAGTLIYQVGYFDGVVDGVSTDANTTPDVDNNDKKDWSARLFAQPFLNSGSALKGLGAGIAVGYTNEVGSATNTLLPTYKTETQRNFFSYDSLRTVSGTTPAAGAVIANGERLRWSPQAYYYYRSFGLLGEYVGESQDVSRTFGTGAAAFTRRARLSPDSWQVTTTYLLTGDDASFGTVTPKRPYVAGEPGWGALEVAARYSVLTLDPATFSSPAGRMIDDWFADPSSQPRKATAYTFGVNWYLTTNVAWYLNYTETSFDGGAPGGRDRGDESAFFTRFQVAF